jgi:type IV secretory pathway ATPase VirB11/archaellum biosynthesis ATPase
MSPLTLADLVQNRTMSPDMAATLAVAAEERRSILFVAIPRLAGKTTVMRAALQFVPEGTALHPLSRAFGRGLGIPDTGDEGYLLFPEISPAGFEDYLWGADVRAVFAALPLGFSLVTALHAGSVEEAFEVITRQNGVPNELAARLDVVVYIRSIGPWHCPARRVVAEIHEVHGVRQGRPEARLLHRWSEAEDRFDVVEQPQLIGAHSATLDGHRARFRAI